MLESPRRDDLTRTHNLCFGPKIRKIGIPLQTPFLLYKSGVYGGIYFMVVHMLNQWNRKKKMAEKCFHDKRAMNENVQNLRIEPESASLQQCTLPIYPSHNITPY